MGCIKIEPPILYSKRTCPFCIRARLAVAASGTPCAIREVDLKNKPRAMLQASPKGTVPVLVLPDGQVIEESYEIMFWALRQSDPQNWLDSPLPDAAADALLSANDTQFAEAFMRLKFPDKFADSANTTWQEQADGFVQQLEDRLTGNAGEGLGGSKGPRLTDIAILPFLLQYAELHSGTKLDKARFPKTTAWVKEFEASALYHQAMAEYPVWQEGMAPQLFPA